MSESDFELAFEMGAYAGASIHSLAKQVHVLKTELAAYKVAILAQEKAWCLALIPCDPSIIHDVTSRAIKTRHPLVSKVIDQAAIDAAKSEQARIAREMESE